MHNDLLINMMSISTINPALNECQALLMAFHDQPYKLHNLSSEGSRVKKMKTYITSR